MPQKHVCHWDPTFAAYLAKKRAEGKHYNVALFMRQKKLVRLILQWRNSAAILRRSITPIFHKLK